MKEYESLKHKRIISAAEQHEISFEYCRQMEGLPGEKHSLAPKPEGVLDYLRRHAKDIKRIGWPVRTRRGGERYRI